MLRYLQIILAVIIGYYGPAVILHLFIFYDMINVDPDVPLGGLLKYYPYYVVPLFLAIIVAIAGLYIQKTLWRGLAIWSPAYLPCMFTLAVLVSASL